MSDIYKIIDYLSFKIEKDQIEFLDFKYSEESKFYKVKLIRRNRKNLDKDSRMQKTLESTPKENISKELKENTSKEEIFELNNESKIFKESEDLGGFKIKFINEKRFFMYSTLVGVLKLNEGIKEGSVINPRQKIGEIEILNIKNPISLDFKYKILKILTSNKEKLDYGKNIILGEKTEDGNNH